MQLKNWAKIPILIILLTFLAARMAFSGTPHTAYGMLVYGDNSYPASATVRSYLTKNPSEVLPGTYNASSGQWTVQCGNFSSGWVAGDVLHVDFDDGNGATGSDEVTLTNEPYDNAGTTTLIRPIRQVTITTHPTGRDFQVDGTVYNSAQTFSWEQGSTHTVAAPSPQSAGSGTQYLFVSWSDGGAQSHSYTVSGQDETVIATFTKQYFLTVSSAYGNPQGQGWYNEGETATFSVTTPDVQGQTRHLFQNWSGDYSGTSSSGSLNMNAPKTVTAAWQTQHFLDINSQYGNVTGEGWYDSGTLATFSLSAGTVSGGAGIQHIFTGWTGSGAGSYSGTELSYSVVMNNPITETAKWKTQYYLDVISYRGTTTGTGWYDAGSSASFSVTPTTISGDPGVRYVFTGWTGTGSGSYSGPNASVSVIMNNPITETANWKTQYELTVNSSYGNPTGAGWYDAGATANFSVTSPDVQGTTRYVFINWTGDYSGTNPSGSMTMNGPKSITAMWKIQYYLTVESAHGNPTGQGWYDAGTTANFSVTSPDVQGQTRYIFQNWTGDFSGTLTSGSVVMSQAKKVTATWKTEHFLSTAVTPAGAGAITPPAPGQWYEAGVTANFSTTANSGYQFKNWSGDFSGTVPNGSLVMNAPKSVTANYDKISQITIATTPAGLKYRVDGVEYNSTRTFIWVENSNHELSAVSPQSSGAQTYVFSSWSDGGAQTHSYLVPENDQTVTATFVEKNDAKLTMQVNFGSWGSTDPPVGEHIYQMGQVVSIRAIASQGFAFSHWEGEVANTKLEQTTITMNSDKTVKAIFYQLEYALNISAAPVGTGSTVPAVGTYFYKSWTSVPLSATPAQGYRFDSWTGAVDDSNNATTFIVMNGDKTVTANFAPLEADMDTLEVRVSPANGGNTLPAPGLHVFGHGSAIQLSAFPAEGYAFGTWSGNVADPESSQTTITMIGNQVVTANFVETARVKITTSPPGLSVQIDGITFTSPAEFTWPKGSIHTIAVASPQVVAENTRHVFLSWSDGGAQSHEITVGNIAEYNATFSTDHYLTTLESPDEGGTMVPAPPGAWLKKDSVVVAQAIANNSNGYVFEKWSGDLVGSSNPTTIVMNAPKKITAHFLRTFQVTITSEPVNLPVMIDGVSYYTPQTFSWADQSTHTVSIQDTIPAGEGVRHIFKNWSDLGASAHTITVTAAQTLTATMETQYFLRTQVSPADGGAVDPPAPGKWYPKHVSATVIATANSANSYAFSGWSGDLSSQSSPETVFMDGPKSVIANFVQAGKIQVTTFPEGLDVIVDGVRYKAPAFFGWEKGTKHVISAPDSQVQEITTRHLYHSWSDGGPRTHEITVGDVALYAANFTTQYYVTTLMTPPDGGTLLPVSIPGWFGKGTQVNVQAVANDSMGYIFSEWQGDLSGQENPTLLRIDAPRTVHAIFSKKNYALKIIVDPPNAGRVEQTPSQMTFEQNEVVRLKVVPNTNYRFVGWYGDASGNSDTLSVVMNRAKSITAKFLKIDLSAPRLSFCNPAAGDVGVPRNSDVRFILDDLDSGINLNSLFLSLNGKIMILNGHDQTNGRVTLELGESHVAVRYDPAAPFFRGEQVWVRIRCKDLALAGNQIDTSYYFSTGLSRLSTLNHFSVDSSGGDFYDDSTALRLFVPPKQIPEVIHFFVGVMDSIPAHYDLPIVLASIYHLGIRSIARHDSVLVQIPLPTPTLGKFNSPTAAELGVLGYSMSRGTWFRHSIVRKEDQFIVIRVTESGYFALITSPEVYTKLGMPSGTQRAIVDSSYLFVHPKLVSSWLSTYSYQFTWGDGASSDWLTEPVAMHVWQKPGKYGVVLTARNNFDPSKTSVSDTLWIQVVPKTGVVRDLALPDRFGILQNYPNPFNPETTIEFVVPQGFNGMVTLQIHDILGQHVCTLLQKSLSSGYHRVRWNGTSQSGQPVGSGIYYCILKVEKHQFSKKMIKLQ